MTAVTAHPSNRSTGPKSGAGASGPGLMMGTGCSSATSSSGRAVVVITADRRLWPRTARRDDAERSDEEERRMTARRDDAERSDEEERRMTARRDDAERSDEEERRMTARRDDAERSDEEERRMTGGRLLLAATPLGQPSDASARLVAALSSADIVAAEDTRRVRTLAKALDVVIGGKIVSFFDHVEAARVPALVDQISAGATALVVSDAGMPLISDPGHRLVAACVDAGLPVQCLPGPSAVTTALAVSGVAAEEILFGGV